MTLYIFNPEHDICLANGDKNFVPPQSALEFSEKGMDIMRVLYGADAAVTTADGYAEWRMKNADAVIDAIVPWGWDARLKHQLEKQQVPMSLLPDDDMLYTLRQLQHRTTILPLQPHAWRVDNVRELKEFIETHHSVVMKAPWSGAGRGIRWVTDRLSDTDISWFSKVAASQHCVIVEVRQSVKHDFAVEFMSAGGHISYTGMSLFETQSGVYRHNLLLSDEEICERVGVTDDVVTSLRQWLQVIVAPHYDGPIGIDLICSNDDELYVCEMNLRHTMGMVAHNYLRQHPESRGGIWKI